MIPRALYDDIRTLNAPEAQKLRAKYGIGSSGAPLTTGCMGHELLFKHASGGSGAKITIAEAEQLYDVAGGQLAAVVAQGMQETKFAEAAMTYRKEQKKKKTRTRKKAKR